MKIPITALLLFTFSLTLAQTEASRKKNFNVADDIAIGGYDPVSYFEGGPKEGDETMQYSYKGISYLFRSTASLSKFKSDPEKYEPAYGGWCAYAMGETGEKVKVDPETFKILNGKLYLFYNFWGNNTLKDWNKNENRLKAAADNNWKKNLE
jgi:YHS domain-containing protein